jgi:hypothetical protein
VREQREGGASVRGRRRSLGLHPAKEEGGTRR